MFNVSDLVVINDDYRKLLAKVDTNSSPYSMINEEIESLTVRLDEMEDDFDKLSRKMGYIRLRNYVLAEAMYDNLIEYQEFIKNI